LNKQKIVETLKSHYGLAGDSELAAFLGVSKQVIYQFKNGKRQSDINTIIIERLLSEINKDT